MIVNLFGFRSRAMTSYRRLMYWVPKLRHINPWPTPFTIPDDFDQHPMRIALLAARRLCPDRYTEFSIINVRIFL
ncbi:unnamed protein product [Protopolystoma xenopodis]|uniref:ECSIT N-terminal domain-containing protein n=1 Tax=Protopolystoma xenopodis TaxID=117903 RepID=A0A448WUE4_9PLAT|nr:unnamed protein product [Protopolystoma xenopodis]